VRVQLTPDLDRPAISIPNFWRAAAPDELQSEIVQPQEEQLRNIPGLEEIRSSVRGGMSIMMLEVAVGTDMRSKFMDVANALNQVGSRPRDAEEPMVSLGGLEDPLASMMIRKTDPAGTGDFTVEQELIEQAVAPTLREIPGVTKIELNGFRRAAARADDGTGRRRAEAGPCYSRGTGPCMWLRSCFESVMRRPIRSAYPDSASSTSPNVISAIGQPSASAKYSPV